MDVHSRSCFKYLFTCSLSWLPDNRCIPPVAKRAFGQDWGIVGKWSQMHAHTWQKSWSPPRHPPVLQSISFFTSDHLQCLFLPLNVSAVGLNGFGIMDFFMHPFVQSDTLLAVHNCHYHVSFSQYRLTPLRLFLHQSSLLLDENILFYISLFSSSALTLKWALVMGQNIWMLGCFMYPTHILNIYFKQNSLFFW